MRHVLITLVILFALVGCANSTPLPIATVAPRESPAPTLTLAPLASPTAQLTARPTLPAPTATSPSLEIKSPTLIGRFRLTDLPGAGRNPYALAWLGSQLYVANLDTNNLAVIENDTVSGFIALDGSPVALATDETNARLYVALSDAKKIALVSAQRVVSTGDLPDVPTTLAYAEGKVYVGLENSSSVVVLDSTTLKQITVIKLSQGFGIYGMTVDAPRHALYAAAYGHAFVVDLTTLRETRTFAVENIYATLAVRPTNGALWLGAYRASANRQFIGEYDRERGIPFTQIEIGGDSRQALFDASGARLYVVSSYDNRVDVIDAQNNTLLVSIPTALRPNSLALDEKNKTLYVANAGSDSVNVIDLTTNRVRATIPLAMQIQMLAANETSGRVYAVNSSSDSVFVIADGKVTNQITVGRHPIALARDSKTNTLYVANEADGTLMSIDENALTVKSTTFITRALTALDVDSKNRRLFAGSTLFELDSQIALGTFFAKGISFGSQNAALSVKVNPTNGRFYSLAWNGIPGSNSRNTLYAFTERDPNYQKMIAPANGGNVTAFAIDSNTNRVFVASTHPLAYTSALDVWNEQDERVQTLALSTRTTGITINPRTNHIFLSHAHTFEPTPGALKKRDDSVQILDTRTLGEIAWLDVPGAPGPSTRVGDTIFVAGLDDGSITMIADIATTQPPAPTATFTPTPYPTLTPAPTNGATATPAPTLACAQKPGANAATVWIGEVAAYLGCAVDDEHALNNLLARMDFKNGYMLDDFENANAKVVYVIFQDRQYFSFADMWNESLPLDSCPTIVQLPDSEKPKRGFGKVWCEHPDVRAQLGAAGNPEFVTSGTRQKFAHGIIYKLDGIGIVILRDNGTWG